MPVTAELGARVAGDHRRRALHAGHAAESRQAIEHLDAGHGRNLAVLLDKQEHHAFAERASEMSLGLTSEMGKLRLAGVHPPVLERLGGRAGRKWREMSSLVARRIVAPSPARVEKSSAVMKVRILFTYFTVRTGTSVERRSPKLTLPSMPRMAPRPRRPMTIKSQPFLSA